MRSLLVLTFILLSVAASAQVSTQLSAEETTPSQMEPIIIKDKEELRNQIVISSERVEQIQAEDVKESLKGVSDVLVGGGQRSAQKIYVRGVEDTQMNVTVDGARQSGYLFHHQGRLSIDTELLKKIDVEAGTGDALSGPGALGGSLRFETKDPRDLLLMGQKYGALLKLRYATNADEKGLSTGVFGQLTDNVGFLVYGNFADAGNYHAGGGDEVPYTAGKPQSGLGKLVYTPSEIQKLSFTANLREDNARRSLRNHFGDLPFNPPTDQEFGSETYTLQHQYDPATPWVNLRSEIYGTTTNMAQVSNSGRGEAKAESYGVQVSNKMVFNTLNSLTFGTDYNVDRSEGLRATGSESETGKIFGLFAQGIYRPTTKVALGAGLRFDNYDLEDVSSHMINNHRLNPNVKATYQANSVWSFYGGWSQAYKGATPMEAYVMSNVKSVTPVSDLKGTTGTTSELGVVSQWAGLNVTVTAYETVLEEAINVSVNRTTGVMTRSNATEDIKFRGITLNSSYETDVLVLRGGYAHNKSSYGDQPLGYVAFNKGSSFGDRIVFGLDYKLVPYNALITWDSLVTLKLRDVPAGAVEQPGYDVHDISASWFPTERWRLGLSVLNIFDKKYVAQGTSYQVQNGVNPIYEPGRDFRFSLSYIF